MAVVNVVVRGPPIGVGIKPLLPPSPSRYFRCRLYAIAECISFSNFGELHLRARGLYVNLSGYHDFDSIRTPQLPPFIRDGTSLERSNKWWHRAGNYRLSASV